MLSGAAAIAVGLLVSACSGSGGSSAFNVVSASTSSTTIVTAHAATVSTPVCAH